MRGDSLGTGRSFLGAGGKGDWPGLWGHRLGPVEGQEAVARGGSGAWVAVRSLAWCAAASLVCGHPGGLALTILDLSWLLGGGQLGET